MQEEVRGSLSAYRELRLATIPHAGCSLTIVAPLAGADSGVTHAV